MAGAVSAIRRGFRDRPALNLGLGLIDTSCTGPAYGLSRRSDLPTLAARRPA